MSTAARRIGTLVVGLVLVAGCTVERPTAPPSAAPASHDLLGGVVGTVTSTVGLTSVTALQRTTPLPADITVSAVIGQAGGTLSIPAAGVTVTVPYGALDRATTITMTARQGSLVAYDFAPHGITFAKPLVFKQKLSGTNATVLNATNLRLGYYSDGSVLTATTALVSELLLGVVNVLDWSFTAPIKHFSGYLVTWRDGTE